MAHVENEPLVELTRDALNRCWVLAVSRRDDAHDRYVTVRIPDSGEWGVAGPFEASDHTEFTVAPSGNRWPESRPPVADGKAKLLDVSEIDMRTLSDDG